MRVYRHVDESAMKYHSCVNILQCRQVSFTVTHLVIKAKLIKINKLCRELEAADVHLK